MIRRKPCSQWFARVGDYDAYVDTSLPRHAWYTVLDSADDHFESVCEGTAKGSFAAKKASLRCLPRRLRKGVQWECIRREAP